MQYTELEEHLTFFDKASKDLELYSQARTEWEHENAGFISGDLHETHETLRHFLVDSKANFEMITNFLEEHCPNTFRIMISNLDSNADQYNTLFDLCYGIDIRKEDNFVFPVDCLKNIRIYK